MGVPVGSKIVFTQFIDQPQHEHQGYNMDLEDCLTPASSLISKVVHEGRQADASATEKPDYGSYYVGQYSWRTF